MQTQGAAAVHVIEITDLTRRFGAVTALDAVNLAVDAVDAVDAVEVLGLVGPNGAGKSTLVEGCLHDRHEGPVVLRRHDPVDDRRPRLELSPGGRREVVPSLGRGEVLGVTVEAAAVQLVLFVDQEERNDRHTVPPAAGQLIAAGRSSNCLRGVGRLPKCVGVPTADRRGDDPTQRQQQPRRPLDRIRSQDE